MWVQFVQAVRLSNIFDYIQNYEDLMTGAAPLYKSKSTARNWYCDSQRDLPGLIRTKIRWRDKVRFLQ